MTPTPVPTPTSDVTIHDAGTVWSFKLNTDAAREWVAEYLALESWQMTGSDTFAIDWRPARDIEAGMIDDGLAVAHSGSWRNAYAEAQ